MSDDPVGEREKERFYLVCSGGGCGGWVGCDDL